jgi:hypothetical protein
MADPILSLLETISIKSHEDCEAEWREVLRSLRLTISHVLAVQTILKEGRWRNKDNPSGYVRQASLWCAIRMGLVEVPHRDERMVLAAELNYTDTDGSPLPHDERLDLALANYEERFGSVHDDGNYNFLPSDRVAAGLWKRTDELDWERASDLAGLDDGERIVLNIQLMGVSREQALSVCLTEGDRRFLQAAWKRFDRHRQALKETLLSGGPHQSRRIKRTTAEMSTELEFVELANGDLRISFRELVPGKPSGRT